MGRLRGWVDDGSGSILLIPNHEGLVLTIRLEQPSARHREGPGALDQPCVDTLTRLDDLATSSVRGERLSQGRKSPGLRMTHQDWAGSCQLFKDSCTFSYLAKHKPFLLLLCGLTMGIRHQRYSSGSCPSTAGHSVHPKQKLYTRLLVLSYKNKGREAEMRAGLVYRFGHVSLINPCDLPFHATPEPPYFSALHYCTVIDYRNDLLPWVPESQGILTEGSAEKTDIPEKPDFAPSWIGESVE